MLAGVALLTSPHTHSPEHLALVPAVFAIKVANTRTTPRRTGYEDSACDAYHAEANQTMLVLEALVGDLWVLIMAMRPSPQLESVSNNIGGERHLLLLEATPLVSNVYRVAVPEGVDQIIMHPERGLVRKIDESPPRTLLASLKTGETLDMVMRPDDTPHDMQVRFRHETVS